MTIHFLPDDYTRATKVTVAFPVSGEYDLTEPSSGRTVIPERVEIDLTRFEGCDRRPYAYVAVIGPRRLKSGAAGKAITTIGWESVRNDGPRGYVVRPDWLTAGLAANLPEGWDPALLELPEHFDKVPDPLDGCHWCACGKRWPCKDVQAVTS